MVRERFVEDQRFSKLNCKLVKDHTCKLTNHPESRRRVRVLTLTLLVVTERAERYKSEKKSGLTERISKGGRFAIFPNVLRPQSFFSHFLFELYLTGMYVNVI